MIVNLFLRVDRKPYDILRAAGCSSTFSTSYARSVEKGAALLTPRPSFEKVSAGPGCLLFTHLPRRVVLSETQTASRGSESKSPDPFRCRPFTPPPPCWVLGFTLLVGSSILGTLAQEVMIAATFSVLR